MYDRNLTKNGDDGPTDKFVHGRDFKWVQSADVLVDKNLFKIIYYCNRWNSR